MAQWVKDPALSLLWLGELLWHGFDSPAWEFPNVMGCGNYEVFNLFTILRKCLFNVVDFRGSLKL